MPDEYDVDTHAHESEAAEEPAELRPRITGKIAVRFRDFHKRLRESDDLDHVKLASLPTYTLINFAICEWLKSAEAGLQGGRR